ncbi:MAG: membrane integrity-associated transporter subunit PqiC [Candidatus Hydrogenedentes bacterium]|nr:membrane integrity-associated transporter subunit PqiC [Candidatus Hydrogenedentota bacterium]
MHRGARRLFPLIATTVFAALFPSCATRTYIATTRYVIEPVVDVAPSTTTDLRLGIRAIEPAEPYKQKIKYRTEGLVLGEYANAEWAENARDVVTRALRDAVHKTNAFADVGDAMDMGRPDLVLTGELRRFEEDRTQEPAVVVCELRLDAREPVNGQRVWGATIAVEEPVEAVAVQRSAASVGGKIALDSRSHLSAVARAMSTALGRLTSTAAEKLAESARNYAEGRSTE